MTSLAAVIQNHIAYDAWATGRLLDAAQKLTPEQLDHDFGTADKSVKGTLVHLFRSGRTWLRRIEEGTPTIAWALPEDEDWNALRGKWTTVQQGWKAWADSLGEDDASRILEYRDLKGNPWAQPIWQVALHMVNHGTHHRGQVSGFLRAAGTTPPPLDFIAFVRQQQNK
jgi:uncharacterized damage-inducible protein DinB